MPGAHKYCDNPPLNKQRFAFTCMHRQAVIFALNRWSKLVCINVYIERGRWGTSGIFGKLGKEYKAFKYSTGALGRIFNVNKAARLFRSGSSLKFMNDNTISCFRSVFTENACSRIELSVLSDIHVSYLVLSIKILYFSKREGLINLPISNAT